jgi:ribosomal protein L40E
MKGPLHAIRRRRSERPAEGVDTAQAATEAPTEAQPVAGPASAPPQPAGEQPATADQPTAPVETTAGEQPATADQPTAPVETTADVPAGQEPIPDRPSFRQRGRLRRRLRYLRRVRELGFRDLGGLVFDQHRFNRANPALVEGKLHALGAVDHELRTLEHALDDRRPLTELREPGISVCPRCGALHGSEARFCPSCGTPVHGPRAIAEVGDAVSLPGEAHMSHAVPPPPPAQPVAPAPLHLQPIAPESHAAPPAQALWQHTAPQPTAPAEQILPPPPGAAEQAAPAPATSADPRLAEQQAAAERHSPAEDRPGAEQPAGADQSAGAEQPGGAEQPTANQHPAGAAQPADAEQPGGAAQPAANDQRAGAVRDGVEHTPAEHTPAEHAAAGEQPTEVMNRVDEQTANGDAEAVAQRGGERRES